MCRRSSRTAVKGKLNKYDKWCCKPMGDQGGNART